MDGASPAFPGGNYHFVWSGAVGVPTDIKCTSGGLSKVQLLSGLIVAGIYAREIPADYKETVKESIKVAEYLVKKTES